MKPFHLVLLVCLAGLSTQTNAQIPGAQKAGEALGVFGGKAKAALNPSAAHLFDPERVDSFVLDGTGDRARLVSADTTGGRGLYRYATTGTQWILLHVGKRTYNTGALPKRYLQFAAGVFADSVAAQKAPAPAIVAPVREMQFKDYRALKPGDWIRFKTLAIHFAPAAPVVKAEKPVTEKAVVEKAKKPAPPATEAPITVAKFKVSALDSVQVTSTAGITSYMVESGKPTVKGGNVYLLKASDPLASNLYLVVNKDGIALRTGMGDHTFPLQLVSGVPTSPTTTLSGKNALTRATFFLR